MLPGLTRPLGTGLGVSSQGASSSTTTSRWSAADFYPGITTQLSRLNFTSSGTGGISIRGTKAASGKAYLEYTLATAVTGQCGIANAAADLSVAPGMDSAGNGVGYCASTGFYYSRGTNRGFNGNSFPCPSGSIIGIAVDAGAGLIWFNISGSWLGFTNGADPASGVGGIVTPTGALYPAAANGTGTGGFLINTGSFAFTNPIPAGYQAWG